MNETTVTASHCNDLEDENTENREPAPVGEILAATPLFAGVQDYSETVDADEVASTGGDRDDIPGTPNYNWKKYGYTRITEDTFSGGPHPGDYEKDGVLHCGYCHKPKYILHELFGEMRKFPIDCDCIKECQQRIREQRQQREKLIKAENCRRHALRFPHMHQWTFANDDGGSPAITGHAKKYVQNFPELKEKGEGLFLMGVTGTGKTFTAAQIINALCDEGYRCLLISFTDIVLELLSMNREKRLSFIDEICNHDLVVFDGYGAEPSTYFSDMNILEIIENCYNKQAPMIVTTSLSQEQLKEGNTTRQVILSRMKARCYCLTLGNVKRRNRLASERWGRFRQLLGIRNGNNETGSGNNKTLLMPNLYDMGEDPVLVHGDTDDENGSHNLYNEEE